MRPKRFDFDPANVNLTGFLSNATGAGPWTMTTTTSGDSLAHQVSIRNDAAVDYSGQTFTLVGTDPDGRAQTEIVTGPGVSATVESAKYFLTLTTSTASGAGISTDTFDYGWVDEVASKTIPLNYKAFTAATIGVRVTGTINYDIEGTMSDITLVGQPAPFAYDEQADFDWVNDGNFASKTASMIDDLAVPGYRAIRLVINSYTDTAELQVELTQSDNS